MRKLTFFCSLVFFFVNTCVVFAEGTKRTAVIEDSAGVITMASGLAFSEDLSRFGFGINYINNAFYDQACIALNTEVFNVAILIDSLISIEVKNGSATVVYQLRGYEKELTGELVKGAFIGRSNYGDIELSIDKLKKLTFKEPAISKAKKKTITFTDTLVLTNGSRIPVAKLQRCGETWSTKFVGRSDYRQFGDIRFRRGDSLSVVDFEKVKKITFQSGKNVMVTLKNGNTITGILTGPIEPKGPEGAGVVGFTGTYEEGEFFISANRVREIEFGK